MIENTEHMEKMLQPKSFPQEEDKGDKRATENTREGVVEKNRRTRRVK